MKTTGGRGLHVVGPITPARDVAGCLEFSRGVSDAIARTDPQLYTTTFAKLGRERKILIDYLRNNRTNTSICAYLPLARAESAGKTELARIEEIAERNVAPRFLGVLSALCARLVSPRSPRARREGGEWTTVTRR